MALQKILHPDSHLVFSDEVFDFGTCSTKVARRPNVSVPPQCRVVRSAFRHELQGV